MDKKKPNRRGKPLFVILDPDLVDWVRKYAGLSQTSITNVVGTALFDLQRRADSFEVIRERNRRL